MTDAPFDDPNWAFEDKYDDLRMVAEIKNGKVTLFSRNGKIISQSYIEVTKALAGVSSDSVIDGEPVASEKTASRITAASGPALRSPATTSTASASPIWPSFLVSSGHGSTSRHGAEESRRR